MKIRIARPVMDLIKMSTMYQEGLSLKIMGEFKDHKGFDGVMLGKPGLDYHFEFTTDHSKSLRASDPDDMIIFYITDVTLYDDTKKKMLAAGFRKVISHNPYWDENGDTFQDIEGRRIALCRHDWHPHM